MGNRNNQDRPREAAHAPYNFVPMVNDLPLEGELISHDRYYPGTHTGYFDVSLETVTPLFVRGMLTADEVQAEKKSQQHPEPFMIEPGKPVIPGSSLRGMLHNLVGIITFGKLHFVRNNKLVYRAIYYADALANTYRGITTDVLGNMEYAYPSRRMQGGYLQKGESESGWVIQPAICHHGETIALVDRKDVLSAGIQEKPTFRTYEVGVKPAKQRVIHTGKQGVKLHIALANGIRNQNGNGYEPATLIISSTVGRIGGKNSNRTWYPAIYEANLNAEPIPVSRDMWDDFVRDRDLNRGIANRKIESGDVLFYLLDDQGELLFFGPTMFFRVPYENSIGDLIPESLRDPHLVDYTEAMFGYVSEDRQTKRNPVAYAGRISVTSATLAAKNRAGEPQTDVIYGPEDALQRTPGSPKPTTFQHYLEQPNGISTAKPALHHYGTRGAELRGHKLYWRQKVDIDTLKAGNTDGSKENIETTFYPVKEGTRFSFRVYFENLTDPELGALAWALTLDNDPDMYHMLGMGKPYGLGVAKLTAWLVLSDRRARYRTLFDNQGGWERGIVGDDVCSPYIEAFKAAIETHTGQVFNDHPRIKELKAMLQLYPAGSPNFEYLDLKEFGERSVLPYPTEVAEQEQERERQQRRVQTEQFRARIRREGLQIGDEIEGEVFEIGANSLWFEPTRVRFGDNSYGLGNLTDFGYEAELIGGNQPDTDLVVGRIIGLDDGYDPIVLTCEPLG